MDADLMLWGGGERSSSVPLEFLFRIIWHNDKLSVPYAVVETDIIGFSLFSLSIFVHSAFIEIYGGMRL
jgi:hypothetical protein